MGATCATQKPVLYELCESNDISQVRELLRNLPSYEKKKIIEETYQGMTALYISCEDGLYDIAKLLLDHGANPQFTFHCFTPVTIASINNHTDIVRMIYVKYPQLSCKDNWL